MINLTPAGSIKLMILLYKIGSIEAFVLMQFIQNVVTQYGMGVAINTVGEERAYTSPYNSTSH